MISVTELEDFHLKNKTPNSYLKRYKMGVKKISGY